MSNIVIGTDILIDVARGIESLLPAYPDGAALTEN